MTNDESPADRRYREWQERRDERKANPMPAEGQWDRHERFGREAQQRGGGCAVTTVMLAGAAVAAAELVRAGVGLLLKRR